MSPCMKNALLLALPALLLQSCKKDDPIDTESVRLVKTKMGDINGDTHYMTLEYDAQGRITRITQSTNNDPAVVTATISYSGNEVRIVEPAIDNAAMTLTREIKYVVDAGNQPQSRIEQRFEEFKAPDNHPQRTFYSDTTVYTYEPGGLLLRKTGTSRDSTWFNPAQVQTSVRTRAFTATYTNANGNLSEMVKATAEKSRLVAGTTVFTAQSAEEEKVTYEYSRNYANQTDFKNAFLLEEYSVLLYDFPMNKNYRNLPGKFTRTFAVRDASGAITHSDTVSGTLAFSYNQYGFVALIGNNPIRTQNKELIYNK